MGRGRSNNLSRLGASAARANRRWIGQAFNFHEESLAFDGDLNRRMGQFTYFNGIPVVPDF